MFPHTFHKDQNEIEKKRKTKKYTIPDQGNTHMTLGGETDNSNFSRLMFSINMPVSIINEIRGYVTSKLKPRKQILSERTEEGVT